MADIQERHLGGYCDLQPWFEQGEATLAELDAAERVEALCDADRVQGASNSLFERVGAANLRLSRRLDRQHAVAHADFYPAGGIWEIGCAGQHRLGDTLFALQDQRPLRDAGFDLRDVREADADTIAQAAFEQLRRITEARREAM